MTIQNIFKNEASPSQAKAFYWKFPTGSAMISDSNLILTPNERKIEAWALANLGINNIHKYFITSY
jgi:hypothetical protein